MSGRTLVLVACSKGKAAEARAALELYDGPLFRIRREWAEKLHDGVAFILSAKHHLLTPAERVEPYDLTLNTMSEPQREAWGRRVAEQLLPVTAPGDRLLVLAGKHYASAWPALLEAEGRQVERRRFRGLGYELQALRQEIDGKVAPPTGLEYMHPSLRPLAIPVASLTIDPDNARQRGRRAFAALVDSIERSGFRSVIVVQRRGDQLLVRAGNGRVSAMRVLGYPMIPALIFDEGDDAAVEHAVADNRTAELADWNWAKLTHLLRRPGIQWSKLKLFNKGELALLTQADWRPPPVKPDPAPQPQDNALVVEFKGEHAVALRQRAEAAGCTPHDLILQLAGLLA